MGMIRKQELTGDGVVAEIEMSMEEAKNLQGEMEDIQLFTPQKANTPARTSLRGRNEATKYFLIPKQLRKDLNTMGSVSCQRIQHHDRDIFVYVVHNDTARESYLPGG